MHPTFLNYSMHQIGKFFQPKVIESYFYYQRQLNQPNDTFTNNDNALTKSFISLEREVQSVFDEGTPSAVKAYIDRLKYDLEGISNISEEFVLETVNKHNEKFETGETDDLPVWDYERVRNPVSMDYFDDYYAYVRGRVDEFIGIANYFIEPYDNGKIKPNIKDFLSLPELVVEGDYDVRYIIKYLEMTGHEIILEQVSLIDGKGKDNLARIINYFKEFKHEISYCRKLMLYDCDVTNANDERINDFIEVKRVQNIAGHRIQIGIENLFPEETIDRCINESIPDLLMTAIREGATRTFVRKDRKKRLCNWLCEYGNGVDFVNFSVFLPMIAAFIKGDKE